MSRLLALAMAFLFPFLADAILPQSLAGKPLVTFNEGTRYGVELKPNGFFLLVVAKMGTRGPIRLHAPFPELVSEEEGIRVGCKLLFDEVAQTVAGNLKMKVRPITADEKTVEFDANECAVSGSVRSK